jgi:hypothetical protein
MNFPRSVHAACASHDAALHRVELPAHRGATFSLIRTDCDPNQILGGKATKNEKFEAAADRMVDGGGIEPPASALRTRRSPS